MSRSKLLGHILASLAKALWWLLTRKPGRTDFTRGATYTGSQAPKIMGWQARTKPQLTMLGGKVPARRPTWLTMAMAQWAMLRMIRYVSDQAGYQAPEYWATPWETFNNRQGDCEDQAAMVMLILYTFRLPLDRIGGVWVREGEEDGGHVMAVYWDNDRDPWIIDNDSRFACPVRASLLLGRDPALKVECWFGVFGGIQADGGR